MGATAEASWFQEYCSNGEATVQVAQGHNVNETKVTKRVVKKDGTLASKTIVVPEATVSEVESKDLENTSTTDCKADWGFVSWRNIRYKKIKIEQADGSLFAKDIIGVSKDRRSVEASVICEENGNSETMCPENP